MQTSMPGTFRAVGFLIMGKEMGMITTYSFITRHRYRWFVPLRHTFFHLLLATRFPPSVLRLHFRAVWLPKIGTREPTGLDQ